MRASTSCNTRATAGIGEGDVREADVERAGRQVGARGARVGHVRHRLQQPDHAPPAGDRVLRLVEHLDAPLHRGDEQRDQEEHRDQLTGRQPPADAEQRADHHDPGVREARGDLARAEGGHHHPLRPDLGAPGVVDRGVHPLGHPRLDAVGAHHRRAHQRLADRAEHPADRLAHRVVPAPGALLHQPHGGEQRQEADPDQQRQLPGVDRHHDRGQRHLRDADEQGQAALLDEVGDRVDVGGDPGDERAALLGLLVRHRQIVHVPERLDPQSAEPGLAGPVEPAAHRGRREHGGDHGDGGERDHPLHLADVHPAGGGAEALVHGLLHGHRDDDAAGGGDEREQHRHADAAGELGRQAQPGAHDGQRAAAGLADHRRPRRLRCSGGLADAGRLGALVELFDDGGHATTSSASARSGSPACSASCAAFAYAVISSR